MSNQIRVKQTMAELRANIDAFEQSILPAVLLSAPVGASPAVQVKAQGNVDIIKNWMIANATDEQGVTDYSVQNLRRAYKQLKSAELLHFSVAPVRKAPEQSSRLQQLNHAAPKEEAPKKKGPIELAADDARKMNVRAIWDQCAAVVTGWQGRSHGHTYRGRERLKAIVTKAHTDADPMNAALAQATLEAVKKAADKIYDEPQF